MKIPWRRVGRLVQAATGVASEVAPANPWVLALHSSMGLVEDSLQALQGPQKKEAATTLFEGMVSVLEGAAGRDLLTNAAVREAVSAYMDAYVAFQHAEAAFYAAVAATAALRP